ncbi:MAG: 50S ribosomal protein L9 [Verrucomicrobiota bacterium]|nr:50S ribosomal protein L9 [Verrucomicrobiota bacterium]
MSIQVLLMANVNDLGSEGDVASVSDGYARNYLFPRKLAAPVTDATRRQLAKIQARRETDHQAALDAAWQKAAELSKLSCTIPVKTSEGDNLYGSVAVTDIANALAQQGVTLDKEALILEKPIKELGVFDVKVKLHPEVEASIKVWVVEE